MGNNNRVAAATFADDDNRSVDEDKLTIDLRYVLRNARSFRAMGRSALLVLHFALLFIVAWALRPDLAAAKDALNAHFSEVAEDDNHGSAWEDALNQHQGLSHFLGFYRNAAQDSAERYPDSPEMIAWGDGVILRWAVVRIDLNYHCDRPPPTPALGTCAVNADAANDLLGATSGQWTSMVYPSSFPSQLKSIEFPIYRQGDTQEDLVGQVDALAADIAVLTNLSPTVIIFAVMEDGYHPGRLFELVSETTSITGVWINSKAPDLPYRDLLHVVWDAHVKDLHVCDTGQLPVHRDCARAPGRRDPRYTAGKAHLREHLGGLHRLLERRRPRHHHGHDRHVAPHHDSLVHNGLSAHCLDG